ncbi:metal-sulfur cluster assembly factor [Sulfurospirillum diekertiae]|uniref:Metal-sulfur cluster assembly factor n=1 Tax=Sulfurospirillum diekertiae TaxID=1854492 RepID=A0A858KH88_9BACT|nr:metal-sulfur cluster assembly factor [Sulfurospirillum diekertiae]QIR77264.2 metal-sulfur cluster assembly factor [Sulfurospirillum diekertiae]QIR79877.2 metal-sulfur cluster assembly factor [Sulfurospirillum diekertiae]
MIMTEEDIYNAISTVIDPEVGFDIVSLGLIYGVKIEDTHVNITMTLSTKGCPLHELIQQWTKDAVLKVEGVQDCTIEIVWEPAWNITMASERVKKELCG